MHKILPVKLLLSIFLVLLIMSACSKQDSFVLTGEIKGADSESMLLMKRLGKNYIITDSTRIVQGTFHFEGSVSYPDMYYLEIIGKPGMKKFFLENSDISITGQIDSLQDAVVSGSRTDAEYTEYLKAMSAFYSREDSIITAYTIAETAGNPQEIEEMISEYLNNKDDMQAFSEEYVEKHSSSYIAPVILRSISTDMEVERLAELLDQLHKKLSVNPIIQDLWKRVEALRNVAIGKPAPDFELKDTDGNPVRLSDRIGSKLLLLDFWASWCPPCRQENPNLVRIYQEFKNKGLDIMGISLDDDREKWLSAIKSDNLLWTNVSNLKSWDNQAVEYYGVVAIPSNFLIDEKGVIIAKNLRTDKLYEQIRKILED